MAGYPAISVVIATRNRRVSLESCLHSLTTQTIDLLTFEVIIINDGSTDSTQEFLEDFSSTTGLQLYILSHENIGVAASRNRGIREAKSQLIAFTDDDCVLPIDWLERLLTVWKNAPADVAGVGGPLDTVTMGHDSYASQFLTYLDEFNHVPVMGKYIARPVHVSKLKGNEIVPYLRTSNASFRKKALMEVNGFDPAFCTPGGEDPDLCYRLLSSGYRLQFEKSLVVSHRSRESMKSYFISIRNYVLGELKKSSKKSCYPPVVRNSYSLIPLQKMVSIFLSLLTLPIALLQSLNLTGVPMLRRISFPLVVFSSKLYALFVTLRGCK